MPTGVKLTRAQRNDIVQLHTSTKLTHAAIAESLSLGASTVSRVIAQETGKLTKPQSRSSFRPKLQQGRKVVTATTADHEKIAHYATQHNVTMTEALHALLNSNEVSTVIMMQNKVNDLVEQIEQLTKVATKKSWKFWR